MPVESPAPSNAVARWGPLAVMAAVVWAFSQVGNLLTLPGTNVGLFWPPAGFSLGLMLVWGPRTWPGLALGAFAALLQGLWDRYPPGLAIAFAAGEAGGDVLQTVAGAWLVRRALGGRDPLARPRDLLLLVLLGGAVAQALGATLGTLAIGLGGMTPFAALPAVWSNWWFSNLASVALLTPLCLAWRAGPPARTRTHAAAVAVSLAAGFLVFFWIEPRTQAYFEYFTILLVAWAAFALGPRGASGAATTLAGFAIWATASGRGPFQSAPLERQLFLINSFISTLSLSGLILAAVVGERARAARRAEESEGTLRALLDATPLPVSWADAQGRIEFWNRRAREVFGYAKEDLPTVEQWFLRAYPDPAYRAVAYGLWEQAAAEGRRGGDIRIRDLSVTCKDGSVRTVDILGTFAGERVMVVFDDLTARKQAEAARVQLQEQLAQARKLESVGRLAGGVAHDLNNLLMPILSLAELQREAAPPDSELASDLGHILAAGARARDLTRQLLAFSRQQVLDLHVTDLRAALREAERLLRRTLRPDVRLELRSPERLGSVRADGRQLDQVVMNLVVNAQQAMPQGGTLRLELSEVDLLEALPAAPVAVPPGAWVVLAVSDTGHGMTPDVLDRVFDPFFTTKRQGEGTGLGLALVHGIVSQHGGHVTVESEPGRGSTFRVWLPRLPGEAAVSSPALAPVRAAGGTETILVADDDPVVRAVTVRMLERLGYRVLAAPDGEACLELAAREPGAIDLLLTDVVMPGLDGPALYQRVVALRGSLPVVYMSGFAGDVTGLHGVLGEGARFLQKPFASDALDGALRAALGRAPQPRASPAAAS